MIEDLLDELSTFGWTLSWAFQFEAGHWRVSILKRIDTKIYFSHCADAPTFAIALEYAILKINEAECEDVQPVTFTQSRSAPIDLTALLGIRPAVPKNFPRRI